MMGKFLTINEIAAFAHVNFIFLVILSELTIQFNVQANRFWYVCDNFRGQIEIVKMDHYFQCSAKQGYVYMFEDFF